VLPNGDPVCEAAEVAVTDSAGGRVLNRRDAVGVGRRDCDCGSRLVGMISIMPDPPIAFSEEPAEFLHELR
jgi:hypothetical protein